MLDGGCESVDAVVDCQTVCIVEVTCSEHVSGPSVDRADERDGAVVNAQRPCQGSTSEGVVGNEGVKCGGLAANSSNVCLNLLDSALKQWRRDAGDS